MNGPAADAGALPHSPLARKVGVVCESTACLPSHLTQRYDVGVIPIPFVFDNETFLDGTNITPSEFYDRLRKSRIAPKTSPPSPGAYLEAWRAAGRSTGAVLSVTVNSRLSTLQRSARLAEQLAASALPLTRVTLLDSGSAAMGQGFVTLAAARAAMAGHDLETVVHEAERVREAITMLVTLDRLEYLARASHLPQVATFVSSLLPIRPVIQLAAGNLHLVGRPRSRQRAIDQLLERMRRLVTRGALHVAVQHAGAAEEAAGLERAVRERFECEELYSSEFTPVMGGYAGPGLLGVVFYVDRDTRT